MKVKIVGKVYDVEFVSEVDPQKSLGECVDSSQLIKIQTGLHPETQADTLLHEIIHGIDFAFNAKLTERQVHSVATGILAVLYDNPEIVAWIMDRRPSENE